MVAHLTSIAIINRSSVVPDEDVRAAVAAVQKQVLNEFAGYGWPSAEVVFVNAMAAAPSLTSLTQGVWQLTIMDDTTQAGDLGYHDLTQTSTGQPFGLVFAKTCAQYNIPFSTTLSHETLEMLADPWICEVAMHQTSDTEAVFLSYEVCDACENQSYKIDGIEVSDFVTPAWFEDWRPKGSVPFTFLKSVDAPLTLCPGGYISQFSPGKGWQQVSQGAAARMAARIANGKFTRAQRRMARGR